MTRLTAAQAARVVGITPTSLHRWVRQGRLTRYPDGYDMGELLKAEAARSHDALRVRAGIARDQWPVPINGAPLDVLSADDTPCA